ncbi:MAG: hypothetical protein K2X77_11380 [Candidatus Obscuribacterales bacterium]|jgi:hypothetical protein|nr:hypothetical protein [Candidatus Obscuribacterales bacterium]
MSRGRFGRQFLLFSLSLLLGAFATGSMQSFAAQPAAEFNDKDLSLLENRYFAHAYGHDPIEKRLERLECLIFGATKGGSNEERLARLNKMVAQRSAMPVPSEKNITGSSPSAQVAPGTAGGKGASASYPVLNTIEWRALKKTYPSESLDQRLDRLESKMFGQPAQTMAYIDRVERLRKTLGITAIEGAKPEGLTARGPMPKARPRGESDDSPFYGGGAAPLEGMMPPMFNPFGSGSQLDTIFGATFDKMFQDMQRQMGDGQTIVESQRSWSLDPKTGNWVETTPGTKKGAVPNAPGNVPNGPGPRGSITPYGNGFRFNFGFDGSAAPIVVPPAMPGGSGSTRGTIQDLPPYADPNSI